MISLSGTQKLFQDGGFTVDEVIGYYEDWVKEKFWILISGFNEMEGRYEYRVFRSPKRGDAKYSRKVMFKFQGFKASVPKEGFFNWRARGRVDSRLLFVTLTFDPKKVGLSESWRSVGKLFNRWITLKRTKFGKIDVVRSWESHESGVCHVHALLLFKEYMFKNCWCQRKGKRRVWRVLTKDMKVIKRGWNHGFSDVQAVNSVRGGFTYIEKYLHKCVSVEKADSKGMKTLAMCWFFRKRAFSVSGSFRSVYHDLILALSNSKFKGEFIVCFDGVKRACGVVDWHLMGLIKGDFPDWDENWQKLSGLDCAELETQERIRYV